MILYVISATLAPTRARSRTFRHGHALALCVVALFGCGPNADDLPPNEIAQIVVQRLPNNPLIIPTASESLGENINGPSVIRVPPWIDNPLGKYYMYFAHHVGQYIRLAYADSPAGPWTVYEPGTLWLDQASGFTHHIASPDVHVDHEQKQIRMYFHGPAKSRKGQWTGVAFSRDGLNFAASDQILGKFYFRVWYWNGAWYAIAKDWDSGWGELYRSETGLDGFERRGRFVHRVRHTAVILREHQLLLFYSRKGDSPERILVATVDLRPNWRLWEPSVPIEILRPETDFEGARYPLKPSEYGGATGVNQVRDPFVLDDVGETYLYYSISGESGIAAAVLDIEMKPSLPSRSQHLDQAGHMF